MIKTIHKSTISNKSIALTCALLLTPLASMATTITLSDDFESYTSGQILDNVGGWRGWNNDSSYAGVVSDAQAYSGSNSLLITGLTSAIHPFSGITSGLWEMSAWQYIPDASVKDNYFIVLNKYADNTSGNKYAIQTQFDYSSNFVKDSFRIENPVSIITNEWVKISNIIDLDLNTLSSYYNDSLISSGTFTRNYGDPLEIATLDLFTNGGIAYYDNINLTQVPEPETLLLLSLGLAGIAFTTRRKKRTR